MLGLVFWITLLLLPIFIIGVIFLIQGAPFVRSDDESSSEILKLIKKIKPKRVLDIGSGDGKLVVLIAKHGFKVDGIEIDPRLIIRSRKEIRKQKISKFAKIYLGNFWKFKVSSYDMIVVYGIKHIMPRLEKKLKQELKPGSYIISNYFLFPNLKPVKKLNRVVLYKTPSN